MLYIIRILGGRMQFLRLPWCANMSLGKLIGTLSVILIISAVRCEETTNEPDCKNGTGLCGNTSTFSPPPVDAMSRLLPLSNETKDESASTIDIITTPESSLGLSAFSKFAQTSDHTSFNPSPFLGVISDKGFQRGVGIGEVFPDTVGERPNYHNRYHHHKGYHAYEGLKNKPNPISHILEIHEIKPTLETIHKTSISSLYNKPDFQPTVQSYYKTTKTPDYPFVFPEKHSEGKYSTISEYKPPFDVYPPISEKPIREDLPDDRPFGHDDRPKFPSFIHGMSPPIGEHKKHHLEPKGNKWRGVLKLLATIIPIGLLMAALSPSILVVNATETPLPTKNGYRSLDGIRLPIPPPGVNITDCQMKEICHGIYSAEKSYQPYIESLIKRSGGVLKEIAEISAAGKCSEMPCMR